MVHAYFKKSFNNDCLYLLLIKRHFGRHMFHKCKLFISLINIKRIVNVFVIHNWFILTCFLVLNLHAFEYPAPVLHFVNLRVMCFECFMLFRKNRVDASLEIVCKAFRLQRLHCM